jgi:hypothetical protein
VYNNYKIQMTERAVEYHRKRRKGLTAAFEQLDTNNSGYVRIASCARLLVSRSQSMLGVGCLCGLFVWVVCGLVVGCLWICLWVFFLYLTLTQSNNEAWKKKQVLQPVFG